MFCCCSAPVKAQSGLEILLQHFSGNQILRLDSGSYTNESGQHFTVTKFKYYLSNFQLKSVDGKQYNSKEVFLVNEEETSSKKIFLPDVPAGNYSSLSFTLGVDSILNCSGIQSGALDPVNGMFWTWNTGYIFLKLEGKSPVSKSPANIYEFHVGGYKSPANCIRRITLSLDQKSGKEPLRQIILRTDVLELFKSPEKVDLSVLSSVTDFHNAEMMADNYSDMFSVLEIH